MPVNTAKVEGRRQVSYTSFEELLADAERLTRSPAKTLGNWSQGQIYRHLAVAFAGSIDGLTMTIPWYLRVMAKMFKKKLLNGSMPPGFKLPADAAERLIPGPTSAEDGLQELRSAVERLQREKHRVPNPVFGEMTGEEWNQLHLKHASLHMSFLVPA